MDAQAPLALALAAVGMGLLGSPHCVGMCGGIAGALSPPAPGPGGRRGRVLRAQLLLASGRIASYALLGALAGSLGWVVGDAVGGGAWLLRTAFGLLLALVGLSVAGWLAGLGWLERLGARAWQRVSPALGALLPADRAWKQVAAGAVWGWLPCGLVYAALAGSAATGSGVRGALMMACFGLGTVPAVAGVGALAGRLADVARRASTRRLAGATLFVFGLWTAGGPVLMRAAHPHPHAPASAAEASGAIDDAPRHGHP